MIATKAGAALRLARSGFFIFSGVRRERDAQTLVREGGPDITPLVLDITDAITRMPETIRDRLTAATLRTRADSPTPHRERSIRSRARVTT